MNISSAPFLNAGLRIGRRGGLTVKCAETEIVLCVRQTLDYEKRNQCCDVSTDDDNTAYVLEVGADETAKFY